MRSPNSNNNNNNSSAKNPTLHVAGVLILVPILRKLSQSHAFCVWAGKGTMSVQVWFVGPQAARLSHPATSPSSCSPPAGLSLGGSLRPECFLPGSLDLRASGKQVSQRNRRSNLSYRRLCVLKLQRLETPHLMLPLGFYCSHQFDLSAPRAVLTVLTEPLVVSTVHFRSKLSTLAVIKGIDSLNCAILFLLV